MKTVLFLPALFATDGGIERIMRLYVRATGEIAGCDGRVDSVVLNDSAITTAQLAPYSTPALASPIVCSRKKLRFGWQALRKASRADRVICGHLHLLRLAHFARIVNPSLEIWLVAHGIEVWREFTPAERKALANTTYILCVSDFTRRKILERCPELDPKRLLVQPNAFDPQFESRTGTIATEPGLMLAVGRLDAKEGYKGVDHLIQALPAIRAAIPSAHLRVIGDGTDRPRLTQMAAESGLGTSVEFAGRVSDAELREQFGRCQLFVLPSRDEGFGLVYLEAMAQGKPCLAANSGGAPEVVNESCGALVPYGNAPAIAEACIALLRRTWDPAALRARAAEFSYEAFRRRLGALSQAPA